VADRLRLLVMNQYYAPGYEATAQLLAALSEDLAATFDVTVVTGRSRVDGHIPPEQEWLNGVKVIRVRSTSYDRSRLALRAVNYITYLGRSLFVALKTPRPDVVLCMTDPPIVANVGLIVARRFRAPLVVISQDIFPEIALELKRLENPVVIAFFRAAINFYLRRADRLVVIGERMRERLVAKGADPDRIEVISNWTDTKSLTPRARDNEWAKKNDLIGKFVVMHSGNVGHAQNLDSLVRAATFLRDLNDFEALIVGSGARFAELVALADVLDADNVRFLPYQARADLPNSLSAADVHVVGLARGLSGYVVPSRLVSVLAVGKPVIVAADADSETARVVELTGCGIVVLPDRADLLAAAIRRMYEGRFDLEEAGRRGREYVVTHADRELAFARYRELIYDVAGRS
jgi:putative colanic acid biosynthesis glycosyltransferase WcaI